MGSVFAYQFKKGTHKCLNYQLVAHVYVLHASVCDYVSE